MSFSKIDENISVEDNILRAINRANGSSFTLDDMGEMGEPSALDEPDEQGRNTQIFWGGLTFRYRRVTMDDLYAEFTPNLHFEFNYFRPRFGHALPYIINFWKLPSDALLITNDQDRARSNGGLIRVYPTEAGRKLIVPRIFTIRAERVWRFHNVDFRIVNP